MFSLFSQARQGFNLTAGQRAFLKLVQGFFLAAIQSLLLAIPTVLLFKAGQPALAAGAIGTMAGSFIHGFLAAWQKYVSAKGDQPLAQTLGAVNSAVAVDFGIPNDIKTEVVPQ